MKEKFWHCYDEEGVLNIPIKIKDNKILYYSILTNRIAVRSCDIKEKWHSKDIIDYEKQKDILKKVFVLDFRSFI